jgi:hypothetical protein
VHQYSNVWSPADQLRRVRVPDVQPGGLPPTASMAMVAGNFLEVYQQQTGMAGARGVLCVGLGCGCGWVAGAGQRTDWMGAEGAGMWDAVVTCFFIDTARNIVEYVRLIRRLLRPGGVWLNLGPWPCADGAGGVCMFVCVPTHTRTRACVSACGAMPLTRGDAGPLLYHYEEMDGEPSLELSYAELRTVIVAEGFDLQVRKSCPHIEVAAWLMDSGAR